jgi:hypothetical protein
MMGRAVFLLITVFWVVMNVLLWRIEFSGIGTGGSPVSSEVVLEKLLTSPDPSTLEVRHQGRTMGYLHWYPDPGEDPQTVFAGDYVPQGMVQSARGLQVRLEGSVSPPSLGTGVRLDLELTLSTNRSWEGMSLRAGTRQVQVNIQADGAAQELEWQVTTKTLALENRVSLKDARDPRKLLGIVGKPLEPFLTAFPTDLELSTPLRWDARLDWMPFGNSKIRIYRLRAHWQDRYEATLLVNRAGEILRIDLPGGWRLFNEGLAGF